MELIHFGSRLRDSLYLFPQMVACYRVYGSDDDVLDIENVIWCTGFRPDFSWIDLPIFDGKEQPKEPVHVRGVVPDEPGLYFVGLFFLYAMMSGLFTGVGRDAEYVVNHLTSTAQQQPRPSYTGSVDGLLQ